MGSHAVTAPRCHVDSWAPAIMQHLAPVAGAMSAGPPATSAPLLDRWSMRMIASWSHLGCLSHLSKPDLRPVERAETSGAARARARCWMCWTASRPL
mmetsp:Transcript_37521/g.94835  ORF Transcript_37521/g.94835 Transcript_37521/m.94835 type:complete len:97 (+) Transcript_37521:603-893(+)